MSGFTPQHPIVQDLCNGFWRLYEPLHYDSPDGRAWMVPKGFLTDFGSVPAVVDWIIPAIESLADPAYILHDYHYARHRDGKDVTVSRKDADDILLEALRVCGVGKYRASIIYWAVRAAGGVAWGRE